MAFKRLTLTKQEWLPLESSFARIAHSNHINFLFKICVSVTLFHFKYKNRFFIEISSNFIDLNINELKLRIHFFFVFKKQVSSPAFIETAKAMVLFLFHGCSQFYERERFDWMNENNRNATFFDATMSAASTHGSSSNGNYKNWLSKWLNSFHSALEAIQAQKRPLLPLSKCANSTNLNQIPTASMQFMKWPYLQWILKRQT